MALMKVELLEHLYSWFVFFFLVGCKNIVSAKRIAVFWGSFASAGGIFILPGGLCTGLSFCGV